MRKLRYEKIIRFFIAMLVPASFYSCTNGYKNDGSNVYYTYWGGSDWKKHTSKIDADPKTVKIFNDAYAKDHKSVFFKGKKITGADAETFTALNEWFAKDKNKGWNRDEAIENSNGKTFELIKNSTYYSKDDKNVFFGKDKIEDVDLPSFEVVDVESHVSKDKNHYYYQQYKIPVKDYATFEQVKRHYWKDKYYVYYLSFAYLPNNDCILKGVDPKTAKTIGSWGVKDKFGCYSPDKGRVNCE